MNNYEYHILIEKLNNKDLEAFKSLFDIYFQQLCVFSHKITNNKDVAKDIVQDLFITLWQSDVKFKNQFFLNSYLYRSVQNRSVNHLNKEKSNADLKELNNTEFIITDETYLNEQIETEVLAEIDKTISELPLQCQMIFKYSYIDNIAVKDIADMLNISVNTVKTQRMRAKIFLKDKLKNVFTISGISAVIYYSL